MAAEIVRILADDNVRHAMEDAAPRWISARFGRQRMIDDYEAYFRSLRCVPDSRRQPQDR